MAVRLALSYVYETIEGHLSRSGLIITIFESNVLTNEVSTACQGDECGSFGKCYGYVEYLYV